MNSPIIERGKWIGSITTMENRGLIYVLSAIFNKSWRLIVGGNRLIRLYWFRYKSRRQLMRLPEYRLKDIGLSKQQVTEESAKWFWQE